MSLYDQLVAYCPFNEQEEKDKQVFLTALEHDANCFRRSAQAHFTCSAWVVDEARTSTVMVFHNIYNSWSWIAAMLMGVRICRWLPYANWRKKQALPMRVLFRGTMGQMQKAPTCVPMKQQVSMNSQALFSLLNFLR